MASRVERDARNLEDNPVSWCSNTSPDIVQPGTNTTGGPEPRSV